MAVLLSRTQGGRKHSVSQTHRQPRVSVFFFRIKTNQRDICVLGMVGLWARGVTDDVCVGLDAAEERSAHVVAIAVASPMRVLPVVPVPCFLQRLFIVILFPFLFLLFLSLRCIVVGWQKGQNREERNFRAVFTFTLNHKAEPSFHKLHIYIYILYYIQWGK